ncbi:hypothetical protein [Alicyclobacillus dauci]|uniref:Copper amine oxidase N-terminal domain-containing protein n=1 Tax=Alicyclobacillus dauci TaxID=1475485 RepID=A0ABY6YZQ2_9BACL|nr:hypothetical protein [Alicyclobacillus dauci]WAH36113.1 hypothetical protein NZD86_17960 [Alicyclobacillus dauci]
MKKQWMGAIATCLVVLGVASPAAFASTSQQNTGSIVLNNDNLSSPHTINQGGTTYVPLWYVMQALKSVGIHSTWNGSAWTITTSGNNVGSGALTGGAGNTPVSLNGKHLVNVSTIPAVDPSSHHITTYISVHDIANVLKQLNVASTWNSGQLSLQTPDVAALADAFTNSQAAPESQMTANMAEHIQLTLTSKGKVDLQGTPSSMDIQMNMSMKTGTVNGQKAIYLRITPDIPSDQGSGQGNDAGTPQPIQEYIEGTKVWVNQGTGWTEETSSEQLIQTLESQLPTQDINFTGLRNIHSTSSSSGNATQYTATLDGSSMAQLLGPVMQNVGASAADGTGMSPSDMSKLINSVLGHMHGTMSITVNPVGGKTLITGENMTIDMNIPMNSLPIPASAKSSASEISAISLHETLAAGYTYNSDPITPPSDLNAAPAAGTSNSAASNSTASTSNGSGQ